MSNDVYGNYGPDHGWCPNTFPKLSQRILDTVRRTGGWRTYKCMTDQDYPHQQKRFFEEYAAWTAVEHTAPAKLLTAMPAFQLMAKPMDIPKSEPRPVPITQQVTLKKVPVRPTPEQMHDRAAVQKQALEDWRRQRDKLQGKLASADALR